MVRALATLAAAAAISVTAPVSAATLNIPAQATGAIDVYTSNLGGSCGPTDCTINDVTIFGPAMIQPVATTLDEVVFEFLAPPGMRFALRPPDDGFVFSGGIGYSVGTPFGDVVRPDSTSISFTRALGTEPTNPDVQPSLLSNGSSIGAFFSMDVVGEFSFRSMLVTMSGQIPAQLAAYSPDSGIGGSGNLRGANFTVLPIPEFVFIEDSLTAPTPVPLPPAMALSLGGLAALAWVRRRRRTR